MKLKKLLFATLLMATSDLLAQTADEINNERYWIYRDRFRKKFVHIGRSDGESLPFLQFRENYEVTMIDKNHLTDPITDAEKKRLFSITLRGKLSKGEMGIELGNYIAVLATEYKLLKWDGADLTAIRNEIYYAINAINRLDKNAEFYYDPKNFKNLAANLNGFLIRDDIPHGFYQAWELLGDPVHTQGTQNSGIYAMEQKDYQPFDANGKPLPKEKRFFNKDGHMIVESATKDDWVVDARFERNYDTERYGSKINEWSQDQTFGILLGLSFVNKYVDDDFVRPTSADDGFKLVTESKAIVKRLLEFMEDYKICSPQLNSKCNTTFPEYIEDGRLISINFEDNCGYENLTASWILRNPTNNKAVWRGNNAYIMGFAYPMSVMAKNINDIEFRYKDIVVHYKLIGKQEHWMDDINAKTRYWEMFQFYNSNLRTTNWKNWYNATHIIKNACFAGYNEDIKDYVLNHEQVYALASRFQRPQLELIFAALNDKTPKGSRTWFINTLGQAPCGGPFMTLEEKESFDKFKETFDIIYKDTELLDHQLLKEADNKALIEEFWTKLNTIKSNRGIWHREGNMYIDRFWDFTNGEFNGIDYMLLHNLYRIKFGDKITGKYVTNICPCTSSRQFLKTDKSTIDVIGENNNIYQIDLIFRFPEYKDYSIPIPEFLTHPLEIIKQGLIKINGDLTICGSTTTATINDGGKIYVLKNTRNSKQKFLTINNKAKLVIKGGGELYVADGNTVIIDEDAELHLFEGSKIILNGPNAILEIRGRLVLEPNAVLRIERGSEGIGFVRWNMPGVTTGAIARNRISFGTNSKIELVGLNENEKIMEVTDNKFWPDCNSGAINASVVFKNGKIELGTNALLNIAIPVVLNNISIVPKAGAIDYKGIVLWGYDHSIYQTEVIGSRDGVRSYNMVGGNDFRSQALNIHDCGRALNIEGKGYVALNYSSINNNSFICSGITAKGIDRESMVKNALILNSYDAIKHVSNIGAGLSIENSSLEASDIGIDFSSPGTLLARCNTISNSRLAYYHFNVGILSTGGITELAPSFRRNAGGNLFSNFSNSIFIGKSMLYLDNGNNNLSYGTFSASRAIIGETISGLSLSSLPANRNQWDINFNPPLMAQNYNVFYKNLSGTSLPLTYVDNNPISSLSQFNILRVPKCSIIVTPINDKSDGLFPTTKLINTTSLINKNLENAFEETLDKMYNPNEPDYKKAASYWREILTDDEWTLPLNANDAYYVGIGITKMMENVGHYLMNDSNEANSLTLTDEVLGNANSTLKYWINKTATDTNYNSKQIFQQSNLGKAQILHNANDFIAATAVIDNMTLTADGVWKEQADYWQCQWVREAVIKMSDHNPDSTLMANWPTCEYGQGNANAMIIQQWEEKVLPEIIRRNKISKHLTLYPNPAITLVTAELETSQKATATVNIYSADGKCLRTTSNIKLQLGINKIIIPTADLVPGIYTISIETRNIKWNEKVVIEQ